MLSMGVVSFADCPKCGREFLPFERGVESIQNVRPRVDIFLDGDEWWLDDK